MPFPYYLLYFSVVILLGSPVWWAMQSVTRAPVDHRAIQMLNASGSSDSAMKPSQMYNVVDDVDDSTRNSEYTIMVVVDPAEASSSVTVSGTNHLVRGPTRASAAAMLQRLAGVLDGTSKSPDDSASVHVASGYSLSFSFVCKKQCNNTVSLKDFIEGYLSTTLDAMGEAISSKFKVYSSMQYFQSCNYLEQPVVPIDDSEFQSIPVLICDDKKVDNHVVVGNAAVIKYDDDPVVMANHALHQLKLLFGVSAKNIPSVSYVHKSPIEQWQLDLLRYKYTKLYIEEAVSSLKTLSTLFQDQPQIPITTDISADVAQLISVLSSVRASDVTTAGGAYALSQRVFYNHNLLAMLYFPPKHQLAVYTPIFFPVLFGLVSGWYHYYKKRKAD